jgi:hypothetical protein
MFLGRPSQVEDSVPEQCLCKAWQGGSAETGHQRRRKSRRGPTSHPQKWDLWRVVVSCFSPVKQPVNSDRGDKVNGEAMKVRRKRREFLSLPLFPLSPIRVVLNNRGSECFLV